MDYEMYLGYEYASAIKNLKEKTRKYLGRTM